MSCSLRRSRFPLSSILDHASSLRRQAVLGLTILVLTGLTSLAHVGEHPSVHDTVAGVLVRMRKELSQQELVSMTTARALRFLTPHEREILGSEHLSFSVNVPVTVSIVRDVSLGDEPFWLKERGFSQTELRIKQGAIEFDVWRKPFPSGRIGLGVNSLGAGSEHYFVALAPANPADKLEITAMYPGQLRVEPAKPGVRPYVDREESFTNVPPALVGQTLIRTARAWRTFAKLINMFFLTEHPSSPRPDHVVLTWSGDPRTSQSIQWRTSSKVKKGAVAFQKKALFNRLNPRSFVVVKARTAPIETFNVVNDPVINWHTTSLNGLDPDTTYVYCVGDGSRNGWSELAEFQTAPAGVKPFSFMYMGDAQNGLDRWGTLVKNAFRERPDAAFYVMAGDLVNRGAERDDWDSFFYNASGIYDRRQLVPVIGNHECQGGRPDLYLKFFNLPRNGPQKVEAERAYSFEYSNAQFVVLDSNLKPETQTAWLEQQLAASKAKWKFVTYHHPAYSSVPQRDNKELREAWTPLFDKYHVDLALQGHDHAYLRTWPMKGNQRAASSKEGTVYVVAVSGTKFYKQDPRDYTEFGLTNVATYQVLDIQVSGDRLVYRAYDLNDKLRDELIIEK